MLPNDKICSYLDFSNPKQRKWHMLKKKTSICIRCWIKLYWSSTTCENPLSCNHATFGFVSFLSFIFLNTCLPWKLPFMCLIFSMLPHLQYHLLNSWNCVRETPRCGSYLYRVKTASLWFKDHVPYSRPNVGCTLYRVQ